MRRPDEPVGCWWREPRFGGGVIPVSTVTPPGIATTPFDSGRNATTLLFACSLLMLTSSRAMRLLIESSVVCSPAKSNPLPLPFATVGPAAAAAATAAFPDPTMFLTDVHDLRDLMELKLDDLSGW